jgi:uncharacterized protein (TIGR00290 family)
LNKVMQDGVYDVKYLLSTINGTLKRLSMHGIKEELIEAQAQSIGLTLLKVYVYEANNAEYEKQIGEVLQKASNEGINTVIFGDIFLEDLRKYREDKMQAVGMQCTFPLWKIDTSFLVNDFITKGFKTITCCINDGYLDSKWCGITIDSNFVNNLPNTVDACGENGEFHSYCYDGPIYKKAIKIKIGENIYKPLAYDVKNHPTAIKDVGTKGFWFADIDFDN